MSIVKQLQQHSQWPALLEILETLQQAGFTAYLAGGCVRDALLGRPASDLDLATNATPEQIEKLFPKTLAVGKSFGVMRVLCQNQDIEVATFRTDGTYKDGRRPEGVTYSSPQEDAERRDFTVNALFYDPSQDFVIDFVDGQTDLKNQTIRAVGNPYLRFEEDKLRILRALRFVSKLGFTIEEGTFAAIKKSANEVTQVSAERLKEEFFKLLQGEQVQVALPLVQESGVLAILFPEYQKTDWEDLYSAEFTGWQNFSLFCAGMNYSQLPQLLERYRCSNFESKAILNAVKVFQGKVIWRETRLANILRLLPDEGYFFAIQVGLMTQKIEDENLKAAFAEFEKMGHQLPAPFLKGQDIPSEIRGKQIGLVLEEFYSRQLEQKIVNRSEALLQLELYLK